MSHLSVRAYAAVSGVIFTLVSILHLARLIEQWNFVIGGWEAPMWISILGLIIPAYLAYEAFHLVWPIGFRTHAKSH